MRLWFYWSTSLFVPIPNRSIVLLPFESKLESGPAVKYPAVFSVQLSIVGRAFLHMKSYLLIRAFHCRTTCSLVHWEGWFFLTLSANNFWSVKMCKQIYRVYPNIRLPSPINQNDKQPTFGIVVSYIVILIQNVQRKFNILFSRSKTKDFVHGNRSKKTSRISRFLKGTWIAGKFRKTNFFQFVTETFVAHQTTLL